MDEHKKGRWPFAVVFQKALFRSFAELHRQHPEFVGASGDWAKRFTSLWIKAMNRLFDTKLVLQDARFSRPLKLFWTGIGLKADGKVDYSNAGCERISKWISAWVVMQSMDAVPSYSSLASEASGLGSILRALLSRKPVRRGFYDLAWTQLPAGTSESELESEATVLLQKRYEFLRDITTTS
jgi:hypothetical protein